MIGRGTDGLPRVLSRPSIIKERQRDMPQIPTTAGLVEASELGRTMVHEHTRGGSEGVRFQWPHLFDEDRDLELVIPQVLAMKEHGVQTVCDPACMDLNRDVRFNTRVTEATGVRFVMATGVYTVGYTFIPIIPVPGADYVKLMADCFVHDLTVGIQGTDVRAGFLKCAADAPGITEQVEMVHRAVARASLETGAPIMAHSNPNTPTGLDQMAIFTDEGVDPAKVQIAHTGDTDDLDYIERLLATGCTIGLDRYGMDFILEAGPRNATLAALVQRGYKDRLMIGHDVVMEFDWWPREEVLDLAPNWHTTFLFDTVLPQLRELGVAEDDLEAMMGKNVHTWLAA
jgi:phosphotriesterase-related protein